MVSVLLLYHKSTMSLLFTLSDNMIVNIVQFVQKMLLQNWPKCGAKDMKYAGKHLNFFLKATGSCQ